MSFKLKEAVFRVKCREPGCPFNSEFTVKENLMGATEADVDSEALKISRNLGYIKHDSLYGRKHPLYNPEIWKISSSYERIGPSPAVGAHVLAPLPPSSAHVRAFRKGERIIRKGESATTVCEVVRGSAFNQKHPDMVYGAGSTFGAAALFKQKSRLADIVAAEDGTAIGFHNLRELAKTDPAKARKLYDDAMEDIFHIIEHLEKYSASLEKRLKTLKAAKPARKKVPVGTARKTSKGRRAGSRT